MDDPSRVTESKNAPHVLVVDDDAEIGALLARYLSSQGLRVSVASTGFSLW